MAKRPIHKLKIKEDFANAILAYEKRFEIRKNDRGFQRGDLVEFIVVDENGCELQHNINSYQFVITYVMNGYGLKNGYVVFGIDDVF